MPDLSLQEPHSPEPLRDVTGHSLLTAEEAAAILRVPRSWVYSHLDLLPTVRLGRYVRFRRRGIDRMADRSDDTDEPGSCA
jgi:hypothetical protein